MPILDQKGLLSDNTACSMTQICREITKIAEEVDFCITTALLWVRNGSKTAQQDNTDKFEANSDDLGLLSYHRDRLVASADALGWRNIEPLHDNDQSLALLQASIHEHITSLPLVAQDTKESRKLRLLIDKDGKVKVDSSVISCEPRTNSVARFMPRTLDLDHIADTSSISSIKNPCNVFLDLEATRPSTFTTHKTTHRRVYDTARHRVNLEPYVPTKNEVLLYNPYGEVMEGCSSTVYFKRDGKWITPAAICGPNVGVTRRLALENGLCKQGTIELQDVKDGEYIWLSNAVRGFFIGKVNLDGTEKLHHAASSQEIDIREKEGNSIGSSSHAM